MTTQKPEMVLRGNGVSPGVVRGSALKLDSHNRVVMKIRISEDLVDDEVRRFVKAVRRSRDQLEGVVPPVGSRCEAATVPD